MNANAKESHYSKNSSSKIRSKALGLKGGKDQSSSKSKIGNVPGAKKNAPRFITKKEKEAKELKEKQQRAFEKKKLRMQQLQKEIEEMEQLVKDKIKEPSVKRRNSLTSFYEMMSIDQQKQLREEMPSCFLDDISFHENVI